MTVSEMREVLEVRRRQRNLFQTQCGSCRFYRCHTDSDLWGGCYVLHRCASPDAPALPEDGWRHLMGYEPYCDKLNSNADCRLYEHRSLWEWVYIPAWNFLRSLI